MKNCNISNPERAQAIADHINSCVEEGLSWTVDWDAEREKDELKFVEGWDEERKAELAQAEALAESREAEREAERDSEFGPEKDLVLEGISQLNKLANFKPEQQ